MTIPEPKYGAIIMMMGLLSACSVTRMLPKGPVLSDAERMEQFGDDAASGVAYTGEPRVQHPVLPFLVFGATYDLDIVLVSKHPKWDMHEYARLQTPEGPLWLAKDTRESDGNQLLVADIDEIHTWMPEIPLARKSSPVRVTNRSEDDTLDLEFDYENHDGERVHAEFIGPRLRSKHLQSKRNGSTMGHSRDQVMAVLDLSHRSFGSHASMQIGGTDYGIERAAWVMPLRLALSQTQGGLAEAAYDLRFEPRAEERAAGFRSLHHMPGDQTVERSWEVQRQDDELVARQVSDLRTLGYRFRVGGDGEFELLEAWVRAWNAEEPTFHIAFNPALPDLRRRFRGRHESRWVMNVAGRENHAVGRATVTWNSDRPTVDMRAEEPWWVADRCVTTSVEYTAKGSGEQKGVSVDVRTDVRPCSR